MSIVIFFCLFFFFKAKEGKPCFPWWLGVQRLPFPFLTIFAKNTQLKSKFPITYLAPPARPNPRGGGGHYAFELHIHNENACSYELSELTMPAQTTGGGGAPRILSGYT